MSGYTYCVGREYPQLGYRKKAGCINRPPPVVWQTTGTDSFSGPFAAYNSIRRFSGMFSGPNGLNPTAEWRQVWDSIPSGTNYYLHWYTADNEAWRFEFQLSRSSPFGIRTWRKDNIAPVADWLDPPYLDLPILSTVGSWTYGGPNPIRFNVGLYSILFPNFCIQPDWREGPPS